jgi:hypothetical protein
MMKRMADWLEKVSVAAFAVGIFYGQLAWGLSICIATLVPSLILTKIMEE